MSNSIKFYNNSYNIIVNDKYNEYSFEECMEFIINNPFHIQTLTIKGNEMNKIEVKEILELLFEWNNIKSLYIESYYRNTIDEEFLWEFVKTNKLNPEYFYTVDNNNYDRLISYCTNLKKVHIMSNYISVTTINSLILNKNIESVCYYDNISPEKDDYNLLYTLLIKNSNIIELRYIDYYQYNIIYKKIKEQLEINIHNKTMRNKTLQQRLI